MRRVLLILFGLLVTLPAMAGAQKPVRFGLTAVVVRENLRFFDDMSRYLSRKIGRPVTFVQRKSYREIMDLLESGSLDFAWICGYPYVQKRKPEYIELIAVPIFNGAPYYRSYIIVHQDSPYTDISGLRQHVFAYSDPDSNSGFLYPRYFLAANKYPLDRFFRKTFFTYNHAETVEAVAVRVADGGAVDSYIWEFLKKTNPRMAGQTRVIHASPLFGFPPIVARRDTAADLKSAMISALTGMKDKADGRHLLQTLYLDGFGQFNPDIFNDIREMAEKVKQMKPEFTPAGYPAVAGRK